MGGRQSKRDNRSEIDKLKAEIEREKGEVSASEKDLQKNSDELADLERRLAELMNKQGNTQGRGFNPFAAFIQQIIRQIHECNIARGDLANQLNKRSQDLDSKITQLSQLQGSYDKLDREKKEKDLEVSNLTFQITGPAGYLAQLNDLNNRIYGPTGYLFEIDRDSKIIAEKNIDINTLNQKTDYLTDIDYVLQVDNKNQQLSLQNGIDASLNLLFSYLKKQNVNPTLVYEKINYREIEHDKLHNINKVMNILFYCFYVAFLIIIICTGNTKREQFLVYLLVGLIPIIYPYLFKLGVYLVNYLSSDSQGPKNAFIDINNTFFKYNI